MQQEPMDDPMEKEWQQYSQFVDKFKMQPLVARGQSVGQMSALIDSSLKAGKPHPDLLTKPVGSKIRVS